MSQTRNRARNATPTYQTLEKDGIKGTSDDTLGPYLVGSKDESMTDVVTPRFSQRLAKGEIINNPCSYTLSSVSQEGSGFGTYENNSGSIKYTLSGPLSYFRGNGVVEYADIMPLTEDGEVRSKLLALANMDSTPYAFGEDVGELGETLKFLKNPISSIRDVSRTFRKDWKLRKKKLANRPTYGKTVTSLDYAQAFSGVWLQHRFALMPFVRSAHDAVEAYIRIQAPKKHIEPERLTARGFAKSGGTNSGDKLYGNMGFARTITKTVDDHASILYTVSNPIRDWRFNLGLRTKDLPTTAWQLVPLSFMVDRLVDISSFSRGIFNLATPGVTILAASYRSKVLTETTYQHTWSVPNTGWKTPIVTGEVRKEKSFSYTRQTWSPTFFDTIPDLTPKQLVKDATYIGDLIAISLSNFRF